MSTPPCPKGCGRQSRKMRTYRGRVALCQPCADAARLAHDQRWRALRSRGPALPAEPGERRGPYSYDDIPAAEIERLYQQALKQIRARRHP